jgi:hypothetical protein
MPLRPSLAVVVASVLSASGLGAQSSLDVPMRGEVRVNALDPAHPCAIWRTVEQVARFTGVRVGFEHTPDCRPAGVERRAYGQSVDLGGLTPRAAFNDITRARPEFAWREIDGVAVMRPVAAWQDPAGVLHRPVASFSAARLHPHLVLHELLQAAQPTLFQPHEDLRLSGLGRRLYDRSATGLIDVPISVRFAGGTLLQALNAVAKPFGGNWELAYAGHPRLHLYTPDFDEGSTGLSLAVPITPTARR